jgi:mono/diheme cytochrome c family protein
MRRTVLVLSTILLASVWILPATQSATQEKSGSTEPTMTPEDIAKKNPIAPTSEGLAEARKLYGYHCAMCHGKDGDGKGELATEMKLELRDWRDTSTIEKMTDGELFFIISNGKGKMLGGEGDRTPDKMRWNLVSLVHSFGKKGAGDKPKAVIPSS